MKRKQSSAFITTRKGFCYLTVKVGRSNLNIMRIRNYTLEPQDKRDMRRLYSETKTICITKPLTWTYSIRSV